jgi:hypothetical protein
MDKGVGKYLPEMKIGEPNGPEHQIGNQGNVHPVFNNKLQHIDGSVND